ncbi:protein tramtrack, beta isoform-like isoform X6 [Artemia franciscana]|uniref:protein tramtrack, beta isoform-like isoform X6 n=1 Tax=Artemia franciscana TaxID=6661 RepID=UPI0032DA7B9A
MEQKEFCLKWNNYLDVFHGTFVSLLNSEHFTDVTLSCDSQSIKCHRLVLSACSSYFETLLLGISHSHPIIILKDVKFHDMQALVKFMYTGEVTVAQPQINSLIKVADMLKVKGLADPDETANQLWKPSYPSERTQMTPPPVKRKRVDTTSENSVQPEDSSQNVEPPVASGTNDNSTVNYPAETSSTVYETDDAGCNSFQVKDEFVMGIHEGGNDSSSQFEDDGEDFDYGSENLTGNLPMERTEGMPNTSLNSSDLSSILRALRTNRKNLGQAVQAVLRGSVASSAARSFEVPTSTLHDALKRLGIKRQARKRGQSSTCNLLEKPSLSFLNSVRAEEKNNSFFCCL